MDDWGNMAVEPVNVVTTTSYSDTDSSAAYPPEKVSGLQAWDHPLDDGTAIDISWNRSIADDFSHYTIWVSEYPLANLIDISKHCEENNCNLLVINQRQIENSLKLQVTLNKALYNEPSDLISDDIRPSIPLYVAVTIHDLAGNVQLSNLENNIVIVTPNLSSR